MYGLRTNSAGASGHTAEAALDKGKNERMKREGLGPSLFIFRSNTGPVGRFSLEPAVRYGE
jgi:hypothetical protein